MAPPLTGVWATAPYFHNGSVPTLYHVLHPAERPVVWKVSSSWDEVDLERVGLKVESLSHLPTGLDWESRREYRDSSGFSSSSAGHLFPNKLSELEKDLVLEFLKTL